MKANSSTQSDFALTSLTDGSLVPKADARVEAYGTVDELNSHVGLLLAAVSDESLCHDLLTIQRELFGVGGLLAQPDAEVAPWVAEASARWLAESRRLLAASPCVRAFVLPSGREAACRAHVCRTICRRAERRVCALLPVPATLAAQDYLNRLSSYFFALARRLNMLAGCAEKTYRPLPSFGNHVRREDGVSGGAG